LAPEQHSSWARVSLQADSMFSQTVEYALRV
jgi:hypothetical protein